MLDLFSVVDAQQDRIRANLDDLLKTQLGLFLIQYNSTFQIKNDGIYYKAWLRVDKRPVVGNFAFVNKVNKLLSETENANEIFLNSASGDLYSKSGIMLPWVDVYEHLNNNRIIAHEHQSYIGYNTLGRCTFDLSCCLPITGDIAIFISERILADVTSPVSYLYYWNHSDLSKINSEFILKYCYG